MHILCIELRYNKPKKSKNHKCFAAPIVSEEESYYVQKQRIMVPKRLFYRRKFSAELAIEFNCIVKLSFFLLHYLLIPQFYFFYSQNIFIRM